MVPLAVLVLSLSAFTSAALKRFVLDINYTLASPDGYEQRMILANGQIDYPIVADARDDLEITVINNLDVPTSLHWHGIFQKGTPWFDGAAGVTQCPIQPGETFVYKFTVGDQVGTYWWHAHYKGQYISGLRGPFIVNDPESPYLNYYDEEIVVTLTDHYHNSSDYLIDYYFSANEGAHDPVPQSGLISGVGVFNCSLSADHHNCAMNKMKTFSVSPGKRYLLRLINTGADSMFNFTIDGHTMTVVEADGVYTVATEVDLLSIYSSQRYAVIVTASHSAGNFWMRATSDPTYWNDLKFEESGFNPDIRAIWRVGRAPDVDPESKSVIATVLDPYILGELGGTMKMDLPTVFDKDINMTWVFDASGTNNVTRITVSVDTIVNSQYKTPSYPTLLHAIYGTRIPESTNGVDVRNGSFVLLRIINNDPMEHVFHLHGHTFWVYQAGYKNQLEVADNTTASLARRDSISVPRCIGEINQCEEFGYVTLVIHFDNPGVWLFHCHIEWHMEAGFSFTFINREGLDKVALKGLPDRLDSCHRQMINV